MSSSNLVKKSDYESYLEVDLEKLFGTEVPNDSSLRQAIGQEILDTIVERTKKEEFLNQDAKKQYSSTYASSPEFEAFGKSKSHVNLTQSGDMLSLLDIIGESKNKIIIGWDDKENKAKGTNHNYGITVPERRFLGLKEDEEKEIKEKFKDDIQRNIVNQERVEAVDNLRDFILGKNTLDLTVEEQQTGLMALINNQLKRFGS